jgi:hypothetical protein
MYFYVYTLILLLYLGEVKTATFSITFPLDSRALNHELWFPLPISISNGEMRFPGWNKSIHEQNGRFCRAPSVDRCTEETQFSHLVTAGWWGMTYKCERWWIMRDGCCVAGKRVVVVVRSANAAASVSVCNILKEKIPRILSRWALLLGRRARARGVCLETRIFASQNRIAPGKKNEATFFWSSFSAHWDSKRRISQHTLRINWGA